MNSELILFLAPSNDSDRLSHLSLCRRMVLSYLERLSAVVVSLDAAVPAEPFVQRYCDSHGLNMSGEAKNAKDAADVIIIEIGGSWYHEAVQPFGHSRAPSK